MCILRWWLRHGCATVSCGYQCCRDNACLWKSVMIARTQLPVPLQVSMDVGGGYGSLQLSDSGRGLTMWAERHAGTEKTRGGESLHDSYQACLSSSQLGVVDWPSSYMNFAVVLLVMWCGVVWWWVKVKCSACPEAKERNSQKTVAATMHGEASRRHLVCTIWQQAAWTCSGGVLWYDG